MPRGSRSALQGSTGARRNFCGHPLRRVMLAQNKWPPAIAGGQTGKMGLACANPLVAVAELDLAYASTPVEGSTLLQVLGRIPHGAVVDRVDAQTAIIAPAVQVSQLRAAAGL